MRLFQLHRDTDVSGISGTGIVADGIEFDDGATVIRWRGDTPSTVVWDNVADAMQVHGHGGATRFVCLGYDGKPLGGAPEPKSRTERGFDNYTEFVDTYDAKVIVRQSSSAEVEAVWVFISKKGNDQSYASTGAAHLDADRAVELRDTLNGWLHSIGHAATWIPVPEAEQDDSCYDIDGALHKALASVRRAQEGTDR